MFGAGDSFRLTSGGDAGPGPFLWFVLSEVVIDEENVVIVPVGEPPVSTKHDSFFVLATDHPHVATKADKMTIRYNLAKVVQHEVLELWRDNARLITEETATPGLLDKLRGGAGRTEDIQLKVKKVLLDQGLI